ncbi:MAG: hypothetical protein AAFR35_07370 [Pseudomonadota bacterium]
MMAEALLIPLLLDPHIPKTEPFECAFADDAAPPVELRLSARHGRAGPGRFAVSLFLGAESADGFGIAYADTPERDVLLRVTTRTNVTYLLAVRDDGWAVLHTRAGHSDAEIVTREGICTGHEETLRRWLSR